MTVSSSKYKYVFAISGLRREVDETCALLGYYAAYSGNSLPTFRANISVIFKGQEIQEENRPSSWISLSLTFGPIGCP